MVDGVMRLGMASCDKVTGVTVTVDQMGAQPWQPQLGWATWQRDLAWRLNSPFVVGCEYLNSRGWNSAWQRPLFSLLLPLPGPWTFFAPWTLPLGFTLVLYLTRSLTTRRRQKSLRIPKEQHQACSPASSPRRPSPSPGSSSPLLLMLTPSSLPQAVALSSAISPLAISRVFPLITTLSLVASAMSTRTASAASNALLRPPQHPRALALLVTTTIRPLPRPPPLRPPLLRPLTPPLQTPAVASYSSLGLTRMTQISRRRTTLPARPAGMFQSVYTNTLTQAC